MIKNKINKIILFCFLFTSPFIANADDIDDGNDNGDVNDVAPAPINNNLPLALIAAVGLSYVLLRKKTIKE